MKVAYKDRNGIWVVADELAVNKYELENTVDEVKAVLDNVRTQAVAMGMVGDGRLDFNCRRGYYDDDYEVEVYYYFDRLETEAERLKRVKAEELRKEEAKLKRKLAAEKKKLKTDPEYVEFERLKAKFGG